MVRLGLAPVEALRTATSAGASNLGLDGTGVVAAGLDADLVIVDGDPTADLDRLGELAFVVKGGRVVREPAVAG